MNGYSDGLVNVRSLSSIFNCSSDGEQMSRSAAHGYDAEGYMTKMAAACVNNKS